MHLCFRSLWKHFRAVSLCLFLLIFPAYMAYMICQFFHMDFWLLIIISSSILTSLQVTHGLSLWSSYSTIKLVNSSSLKWYTWKSPPLICRFSVRCSFMFSLWWKSSARLQWRTWMKSSTTLMGRTDCWSSWWAWPSNLLYHGTRITETSLYTLQNPKVILP